MKCDRIASRDCILFCAVQWCLMLGMGFPLSLGVIYYELLQVFSESKGITAAVATTCFGVLTLSGVLAGLFVQRFGLRTSVLLGGCVSSFGLLASFFSNGVVYLIVSLGIVAALGFSLLSMSGFVASALVLPGPKRLLLGIAFSSVSLGAVLFQQTGYFLIQEYGMRGCFLFLSGLCLNTIPAGLFIGMAKVDRPSITSAKSNELRPVNYKVIKSYVFILWVFAHFLAGSNINFTSVSLSDYFVELGQEEKYATLLLSLISGSTLLGSLTNGIISQRFKNHALKIQCTCFTANGLFGMALSLTNNVETLILVICLCGISRGFVISSRAIGTHLLTSSNEYPLAFGIVVSAIGLGTLISGPTLGSIRDLAGTYKLSYLAMGAIQIGSAILVLIISIMESRNRTSPQENVSEQCETRLQRNLISPQANAPGQCETR